jgi:hypothetical protein
MAATNYCTTLKSRSSFATRSQTANFSGRFLNSGTTDTMTASIHVYTLPAGVYMYAVAMFSTKFNKFANIGYLAQLDRYIPLPAGGKHHAHHAQFSSFTNGERGNHKHDSSIVEQSPEFLHVRVELWRFLWMTPAHTTRVDRPCSLFVPIQPCHCR